MEAGGTTASPLTRVSTSARTVKDARSTSVRHLPPFFGHSHQAALGAITTKAITAGSAWLANQPATAPAITPQITPKKIAIARG